MRTRHISRLTGLSERRVQQLRVCFDQSGLLPLILTAKPESEAVVENTD